jgi:putative transposase
MSQSQSEAKVCKYCQSENTRKFGYYKDTQLYYCNACKRKFTPNDSLFHMHTPANQVSSAIRMYYSGMSIEAIQDFLKQETGRKPSTATIFEWVNKYTREAIEATKNYHPQVGDTWVADETYVRVDMRKKGDQAVVNPYTRSKKARWIIFWDIIDADTRYLLASHITTTRGAKDAQALMQKAAERAGKVPKVVVTDRLKAYLDGVEMAYGADAKHKLGTPFEIENNTNLIERFHGSLKGRTKVMRALRNKDSAQKFTDGWLVHYNYIREHGALDDKTPAEVAKVDYPFRDWSDLTRMANAAYAGPLESECFFMIDSTADGLSRQARSSPVMISILVGMSVSSGEDLMNDQPENTPEEVKTALTSIHDAYTLAGTRDENESEVDKLQVKHFLDTVAEVALSIASRKVKG